MRQQLHYFATGQISWNVTHANEEFLIILTEKISQRCQILSKNGVDPPLENSLRFTSFCPDHGDLFLYLFHLLLVAAAFMVWYLGFELGHLLGVFPGDQAKDHNGWVRV